MIILTAATRAYIRIRLPCTCPRPAAHTRSRMRWLHWRRNTGKFHWHAKEGSESPQLYKLSLRSHTVDERRVYYMTRRVLFFWDNPCLHVGERRFARPTSHCRAETSKCFRWGRTQWTPNKQTRNEPQKVISRLDPPRLRMAVDHTLPMEHYRSRMKDEDNAYNDPLRDFTVSCGDISPTARARR